MEPINQQLNYSGPTTTANSAQEGRLIAGVGGRFKKNNKKKEMEKNKKNIVKKAVKKAKGMKPMMNPFLQGNMGMGGPKKHAEGSAYEESHESKKKEAEEQKMGMGGPKKHAEGSAYEEKHESKFEAEKEGDIKPISSKYKHLAKK